MLMLLKQNAWNEARDCSKLSSRPSNKPAVKTAAAAVEVQAENPDKSEETIQSCIREHELLLANGMKLTLLSIKSEIC